MIMQIINPATEELLQEIEADTSETIAVKFKALQQAQPAWSNVTLTERIETIDRFSKLLASNIERLAGVLTSEVGKPLQQSRNEINGAISRINWMTANAEKYLADEIMNQQEGLEERITYEPLGIVCNISAWNYPYLVGVNVFVPALLAGNAVIYKPSEHATLTGLEIEKLLNEAGIPNDVFQVAKGGGQVGEMLLSLEFNGYFFTGSYKTGKHIYESVANKMVVCQLELGGKDPLYVAGDVADVAAVAAATADGAFYNNGQSCCAVERIYVHEKVYDEYVTAFKNEVSTWKIGLPTEEGVYFGAVTRKEQIEVLKNQVADAVSKGATLIAGGRQIDRSGYYFEPTILTNVTHDMQLMKDESFGPIIGIMKVANDAEAVSLMKDTEYGLTASVYSKDKAKAERILKQLNTGSGYWNCCDRVSATLPWSGRKHSGFGATLSYAGLRAFVKPKGLHLRSS